MMLAELQHADKVEGMFAEAMSDKTYLEHYGVQGMRWGVRKERESSGNGRRRSSSVKQITSDKQKLSTGQKAALAIVGTIVLRKNIGKIMKYGTRDGIKRMKAYAKLDAKYGTNLASKSARLNFKVFRNTGKVGMKTTSKAAPKITETAAKTAKKNIDRVTNSPFNRLKNFLKKSLSTRTEVRAQASKAKVEANKKITKTVDKIKDKKAKGLTNKVNKRIANNPNGLLARIKYQFETRKQVYSLEKELPNKIGKLNKEADKATKMSKLKNARAAQVADVHRRYDPALSKAAGRKGAATRAINEAEKKTKKKRR